MGIFSDLEVNDNIKAETDNVGGFVPLSTNLYDFKIELAYVTHADSGAMALNLQFKNDNNQNLRAQFWVASSKAKGNKNYYVNKNGDKAYLPGFNQANALALLTVGKSINELDSEPKVINIYDFSEKKEMPTKVEMLMDLIGQDITLGVVEQIVDINVKDDTTGTYVPSGKTRVENEVDKIFRYKDGMTVPEIKAQATEAAFKSVWLKKWKGQIKDKSDKNVNPSVSGSAMSSTANTTSKKSLFA
jgi:hypothetical protein